MVIITVLQRSPWSRGSEIAASVDEGEGGKPIIHLLGNVSIWVNQNAIPVYRTFLFAVAEGGLGWSCV